MKMFSRQLSIKRTNSNGHTTIIEGPNLFGPKSSFHSPNKTHPLKVSFWSICNNLVNTWSVQKFLIANWIWRYRKMTKKCIFSKIKNFPILLPWLCTLVTPPELLPFQQISVKVRGGANLKGMCIFLPPRTFTCATNVCQSAGGVTKVHNHGKRN